jgi:alpha-ketoglutarate-dependent taurine dioxygenase
MAAVHPLETPYSISPREGDAEALPLVVEPRGDRDRGRLCGWLRANSAWVQGRLARNGAILFRGFDVPDAAGFEQLARAIDDDLKNEYLGTSPRTGLTDYVFTASELPGYYPIPQHCEMSFTASPPRRVFFCCLREPAVGTGETPLCDFRKVWRDLDPAVRERFEKGGIRIVRNYTGPEGGGRFDLFQLKRWDEMFLTTDRAAVEATCRREGFEPHWLPGGRLRLVSTQPVTRVHPVTGETVWHNHVTTFHLSAAPGEYARIFRLRPSLRSFGFWQLSRALVALQRATRSSDDMAMHCTRVDGREIPDADVEAVREAVWKHLVIMPWRKGDVVAIDNQSVSHGRLPYAGPREIAVCWA